VHTGIRTISLSSTKLSNDRINSLVGLTYHHFVIHGIVVIVVMLGIVVLIVMIVVLIVVIVVLIPSNLIENSAVCINVRGTSRAITTRILHRCPSVQALLGFLLRMMVQAGFWWWIATTIHHEVSPDGSGRESVEVDARAAGVQHVCSLIFARDSLLATQLFPVLPFKSALTELLLFPNPPPPTPHPA
jgi:hypothetical protein